MKNIILISSLLLLMACGGKSESLKKIEPSAVSYYVNAKDSSDVNTSIDKMIVNNDYPIELALYQDKKFYYNLPNLGDGHGSWEYVDGKIVLKAKRQILNINVDMIIEVRAKDRQILAIQFNDRRGPHTLTMMNVNMN